MDTSPKLSSILVSCWLALFAIGLCVGIFVPRFRGRWGKRGQGAQISLPSQIIWSAVFTFAAIFSLAAAYHCTWAEYLALPVLFPLVIALFVMGWYDNKSRK